MYRVALVSRASLDPWPRASAAPPPRRPRWIWLRPKAAHCPPAWWASRRNAGNRDLYERPLTGRSSAKSCAVIVGSRARGKPNATS